MNNKKAINFDDGGSGSVPVVLLHSLAGNSQQWAAQLQHLRKSQRAVAIDLRGHGKSALPADGKYDIEALATDVQFVVDELGIKRFLLVGHSMGGSVAISYAGMYPDQVAGLLLVDPSGDATQMPIEQAQQYIGALESAAYQQVIESYWQQILSGSTADTQAQVMQDLRATPKDAVVGISKSLLTYNPLPALKQYPGPKLSVITPLNETPIGLHELVVDLPFVKVSNTGHWLQMDKPAMFNSLLDEFFLKIIN